MKKTIAVSSLILITVIAACSNKSGSSEQLSSKAKAPVSITHITHGTISDSVSIYATTFYLKRNLISAPISGNITETNIQQGEPVKKGQILFKMQTREASALQSDTLSQYGNVTIRASKSGTISTVYQNTGDFVQQGNMLAKIASPDNLYLKLFVPLKYGSKISQRHPIQIQMPSGQTISATFYRALSEADSSSQSLVWLFKPHQQQLLPKGLTFSVKVVVNKHKNTQILPKKAVLSDVTLDSFWVMKVIHDTLAVKVPIQKGIENSSQVEILKPHFSPDDKIIIEGQYGLEDSSRVQIQNGGTSQ